jgi:hypothetical protein
LSAHNVPHLDECNLALFDFFDFGAGIGASLHRSHVLFGGRGLGIEVDRAKIAEARALGREVVEGDIYSLPRRNLVRYVVMDNVLEHLPTLEDVGRMLEVGAAVAREFLFIVHPSFEDEAYLGALGLRQYWHDWTGHPTHILVSDFVALLRPLGLTRFELEYRYPIYDSTAHEILPTSAPPDQHDYDAARHGLKPVVHFSKPVFRQLLITVPLAS